MTGRRSLDLLARVSRIKPKNKEKYRHQKRRPAFLFLWKEFRFYAKIDEVNLTETLDSYYGNGKVIKLANLTQGDRIKYQRQIIIPQIGESGQKKLKEARVAVVGAGGLGSSLINYIAAAGIGDITIFDGDRVELSNLNRQILHGETDVGKKKVDSALEKLIPAHSDVRFKGDSERITDDNAVDLLKGCDAIIDCVDNIPSRYVLNRAAFALDVPLFFSACYAMEGRVSVIIPGKTPCVECFIPHPPPTGGEVPVIGFTPGIFGAIQAAEVVKYFTGAGELLAGKMLIYDIMKQFFSVIELSKRDDCPNCRKGDDGK